MLFEKIQLKNFGVFRGEHSIRLTPRSVRRPVILIGALNGAGKTTIIEALQLALYGKRSSYGWRGSNSYTQYLTEARNRSNKYGDTTSLEVSLRINSVRSLRVKREWTFTTQAPKEHVSVYVNNNELPDPELSESWDDEVERLLPARLAELFFFDGEKIERLADPAKSAEVLRTAISSLMGLDLVDHLIDDLELIRYRQKQHQLSETEEKELKNLEQLHNNERLAIESLRDRKAELQNELDQLTRQAARTETELHAAGGDLYNQRERMVEARATHLAVKSEAERQLLSSAASILPLSICSSALLRLAEEADEHVGKIDPTTAEAIVEVLSRLKRWTESDASNLESRIRFVQKIDAEIHILSQEKSDYSNVDWKALKPRLSSLINMELPELLSAVKGVVQTQTAAIERIQALDESLARVPEHEQLAVLFRFQGATNQSIITTTDSLSKLDEEVLAGNRRLDKIHEARLAKLTHTVDATDATRIAEYCQRSVITLRQFRESFIDARRAQLERLILEAFNRLIRKNDLIGSIEIDPVSMELALTSPNGAKIATQLLSAGERQILAVSTLWALAKATGRLIPVVIDTPLGRLDGTHRETIVERYFSNAGAQVILLSTDTEIHAEYSATLEKNISYRYMLRYDPMQKSSVLSEGYF